MHRRIWISFGLLLVLAGSLWLFASKPSMVQPQQAPALAPWAMPTPYPDRIILTWSDDPTTTQAVTWRTDTSVTQAVAQIVEASANPKFTEQAQTVQAQTEPLTTDLGTAHYHSVVFRNLKPDTLYAYRVGDGEHWSEWFHFRTTSREPQPVTFLYLGDAQNNIFQMCPRVVRQALLKHPDIRFIIHAGDLVNRGERDTDWAEWFQMLGWIGATIPSVPAAGNHEYARDAQEKRFLTKHWRAQFTLPENGIDSLKESNYYIDVQGVRLIVLNSNEAVEEQANWIKNVLANNPNRWTIVTFHHPVFSSAQGRDNAQLRSTLKPIFDRYRVDLVLQGHDHTYARSVAQESGTIYVNSVTGPKMYRLNKQDWMQSYAEDTQVYQIVRVLADRIVFRTYTATGDLLDAFEIVKRDGMTNRVEERLARN